MNSYERAGKPRLPKWWTDKAFPELRKQNFSDVARRASEAIGRKSSWTGSAISKFMDGSAVTRELANGISAALNIPRPFFEARTEFEAKAMEAVANAIDATGSPNPDRAAKLAAADAAAERERRSATDQTKHVQPADEGTNRSGRPRRSARVRS